MILRVKTDYILKRYWRQIPVPAGLSLQICEHLNLLEQGLTFLLSSRSYSGIDKYHPKQNKEEIDTYYGRIWEYSPLCQRANLALHESYNSRCEILKWH